MKSLSFRKDLIGVQEELLRFAYKLTANREEANDLLQETSLKALDNEDKYVPDTNFKGWMYTIMRNIFINNYRKIVRDQTFVDQTDNLYHLNLPQDSGFDSTEGAYDLKEMHRVVNALPKEYKVPFSMHVSGFKYREIAEKLGLPLGTVKSRIFFTAFTARVERFCINGDSTQSDKFISERSKRDFSLLLLRFLVFTLLLSYSLFFRWELGNQIH